MARPGSYNLSLYQGDHFEQEFELLEQREGATPLQSVVDLTGWTGQAQIRDTVGGRLLATFQVEVTDGPGGRVRIVLPPEEALKVTTNGVWDLQLDPPNGKRTTWLRGKVRVTPEVTV